MIICIPTVNQDGLNSQLSDHFGSAPFFSFFNTETQDLRFIDNQNQHHEHGQCNPVSSLMEQMPNVVLCRGLGQRALERLSSAGIEVRQAANSQTVQEILDAFEAGLTELMDPANACQGHHH